MKSSRPDATSTGRIYKKIRRSIILGCRKPGERLSVPRLAKHYGTSITPVREALQMLSQEGLVATKPHSGFFVAQITLKQLRDMLDLREILEVASVERAAKRITEKQFEQLERIHAERSGDDEPAKNCRFHALIAQASGNQELAEMLVHLYDRLKLFHVIVHTGDEMERTHRRMRKRSRT
jgi:DNA-binding GntR family transcriptional regulator